MSRARVPQLRQSRHAAAHHSADFEIPDWFIFVAILLALVGVGVVLVGIPLLVASAFGLSYWAALGLTVVGLFLLWFLGDRWANS